MRGNYIKWIGGNQEKAKEIRVREKGGGDPMHSLGCIFLEFLLMVEGGNRAHCLCF